MKSEAAAPSSIIPRIDSIPKTPLFPILGVADFGYELEMDELKLRSNSYCYAAPPIFKIRKHPFSETVFSRLVAPLQASFPFTC